MFSDDHNSEVLAHLDAIRAAATAADGDVARDHLEALVETNFNALYLEGARALLDKGDFQGLVVWARIRKEELDFDDPFAGAFDFNVEDMFLDLKDTGFREPSGVEPDEELLDALDVSPGGVDIIAASEFSIASEVSDVLDNEAADNDFAKPRPHVLSGKFKIARRSQEDVLGSDLVESLFADGEAGLHDRSTAAGIQAAPRPEETPTAEKHVEPEAQQSEAESDPLEAEVQGASEPHVTSEPNLVEEQPTPSEPSEGKDHSTGFDFDFGSEFDDSEPLESSSAAKRTQDEDERDRELTPLRQLPAVERNDDDEFGGLVEALAADSSPISNPQYRGEPIRVHSAETNPFATDAPTGTGHMPLPSESHAAQSHMQTNMHAFVLEARRLRDVGEFGAALDIVGKVLSRGENEAAAELRDEIEGTLEAQFVAVLGSLEETPRLVIDMGAMAGLDLDHRAGYIISQVDGMMTYLDLIELSGMPRLETLSVFCNLVEQGVIAAS